MGRLMQIFSVGKLPAFRFKLSRLPIRRKSFCFGTFRQFRVRSGVIYSQPFHNRETQTHKTSRTALSYLVSIGYGGTVSGNG